MKKMYTIAIICLFLWIPGCQSQELEKQILHFQQTDNMDKKSFDYLALGDSYTIGERVEISERFPMQLVKKLNDTGLETDSPEIVAKTGWTTDELATGIKNSHLKITYNLATLLIGVNNQYRGRDTSEYRLQFRELLNTAISLTENDPQRVIVVSIPDYSVTPFAKGRNTRQIASGIDAFNRINKDETAKKRARYVNITEISREAKYKPELIAPDGLHPSGEMYRLWVEEIFPVAVDILKNRY